MAWAWEWDPEGGRAGGRVRSHHRIARVFLNNSNATYLAVAWQSRAMPSFTPTSASVLSVGR